MGVGALRKPLQKLTGTLGVLSSKPVRKVAGNSRVIKTTSQTIGSTIPAIAGGKPFRKTVAQAAAKTSQESIKIAGKVAKSGLILGGTAGLLSLGGVKIYDYLKDVQAKTPDIREYDQTLDLAERELGLTQKAREQAVKNASSGMASGGGLADFLPILGGMTDKSDDIALQQSKTAQTKSLMFGLIVISVIGGGLYLANKKGLFKSKSKKTKSKKTKKK